MMSHICAHIKLYCDSSQGATAIEYGLIATGISLAIATSVYLFGDALLDLFYDDLPETLHKP